MRIALACLLTGLAAPALAQGLPEQGIAFAQAEAGAWLCRHENAEEAMSCAREQCTEQAPGEACAPTAWCYPARWSGTMRVHVGETETTAVLCGAPSEAALTAGLGALCAGPDGPAFCDVTLVVDPEGNERKVEGVSLGVDPDAPPEGEAGEPDGAASGKEAEATGGAGASQPKSARPPGDDPGLNP